MDVNSTVDHEYDFMNLPPAQASPCTTADLWEDVGLMNVCLMGTGSLFSEPQVVTAHGELDQSFAQTASDLAPLYNTAPGNAFRSREVTNDEWERQRFTITQLYVHEEHRLEDVMRIMRDRYGVAATTQMYKKRIKAWNLRKNYTRQQKEDILRLHTSVGQTSSSAVEYSKSIVVNSMPLKQFRIDRHRRGKELMAARRSCEKVSYFRPQHSKGYLNAEIYLIEVACLYDHYASHYDTRTKLGPGAAWDEVFGWICGATYFLAEDTGRAFALLNRACANLSSIFSDPTPTCMHQLLVYCGGGSRWEGFVDLRLTLVRYIRDCAFVILGPMHPVSKAACILLDEVDSDHIADLGASLLFGRCVKTGLSDEDNDWVWGMQRDICLQAGVNPESDLATRVLLYLKRQLEGHRFSLKSGNYQELQCLVADLHRARGEFEDAENAWLEIIQLCVEDTGRENGSRRAVWSCRQLGRVYDDKDWDADAERYLTLAVEGAARMWGREDADVSRWVNELEKFLLRRSRYEEIDHLKQQYAEVYRGVDKYRLEHGSLRAA